MKFDDDDKRHHRSSSLFTSMIGGHPSSMFMFFHSFLIRPGRSRMKSVGCFVIAFSAIYTMILIMVAMRPFFGFSSGFDVHKRVSIRQREIKFYQRHAVSIQKLLMLDDSDDDTPSLSELTLNWKPIYDDFDIHQLPTGALKSNDTTQQQIKEPLTYDLVRSEELCTLVRAYQTYRESVVADPKPHVAWWQNTVIIKQQGSDNAEEGPLQLWLDQGCSLEDIVQYLDHSETLAVLVNQNSTEVQALNNHPKLQPLSPIGIWQHAAADTASDRSSVELLEHVQALPIYQPNRTKHPLLLLGNEKHRARVESLQKALTTKFESDGHATTTIRVVFPNYQAPTRTLLDPLQQSKFVIPVVNQNTRTGVKSLEDWVGDALALGAIPILEENDWYRILLAELPVLWVDNYDNVTPELLQVEWESALHDADKFRYKRLTQSYWLDRALETVAATDASVEQEDDER